MPDYDILSEVGADAKFALADHDHAVDDITATGTADDTTYLRGDGTWATPAGGGGGTSDHGSLTGLGDDDHSQYALADGSRGDFATAAQGVLADSALQSVPADSVSTAKIQDLAVTPAKLQQDLQDDIALGATALQNIDLTTVPAGYIHTIQQNSGGTWPAAGSTRTDIRYMWISRPDNTTQPTGVSGAVNLYDYLAD